MWMKIGSTIFTRANEFDRPHRCQLIVHAALTAQPSAQALSGFPAEPSAPRHDRSRRGSHKRFVQLFRLS